MNILSYLLVEHVWAFVMGTYQGVERVGPNGCKYLALCMFPSSFPKWLYRNNGLYHIKEGTDQKSNKCKIL